ncbi:MAG: hypothetical protein LQ339_007284 [Xanthoria mediterranea]|nr:MAG: hypothetical protein LQ339_007284 [Xanthoria mediterranea]
MEILDYPSLGFVSATLCVIAFVGFACKLGSRPRETSHIPPIIPQAIPFVGHLIEIVKHGFGYLEHLGAKHKHRIFTLQILGKDVHVVNSPDLIMAVQKTPRIYDFSVFATTMLPRLFDLDKEAMKLASTNVDHPGGSWNFIVETSRIFHRCLSPGPSLEKMERAALTAILGHLDELASKPDGVVLDLFAWLRTMMTVSSTEALYGPQNPFTKRPELEQALWDWERDLTRLLLAPAPALLARKGYRARSRLINAMNDYLERRGHETGSDLTKARYQAGLTYGLSVPNIARFELGSIMGVLINSTPTLFWMLAHIYSDAQLLTDVRMELSLRRTNQTTAQDGKNNKRTIDTTTFRQVSPLLLSIYQETLRFHTHNSSSRMVTQDTILAKQYRLQAGSIIQLPGGAIHALPSIWGADAHEFQPRRFLASSTPHADKMKLRPAAFRSFGGGVSLCPGRHFAATEICAAAAMLVSRFEMVAVDARGERVEWRLPAMQVGRITSSIPLPKGDVRVRVSARKEGGEWRWEFGFGGSD